MSGQEAKRQIPILIRVDKDVLEKIDIMRKTPQGEVPRSKYIGYLLRKVVEEEWK